MDRAGFDAYLKSYNARDFGALEELYSDDIVFENFGGHHEGAEVLGFLRQLHHVITDEMVPLTVLVDGDDIAMEADCIITAHQDLPDLPVGAITKGRHTVRTFAFYRTRGGQITHVRVAGWPPVALADGDGA